VCSVRDPVNQEVMSDTRDTVRDPVNQDGVEYQTPRTCMTRSKIGQDTSMLRCVVRRAMQTGRDVKRPYLTCMAVVYGDVLKISDKLFSVYAAQDMILGTFNNPRIGRLAKWGL